jgi:hypothetical protein
VSGRIQSHPADSDEQPQHDNGSVLMMVLAFIIITALIIVPMLNYAITVLKVNSISVEKREDLEAVRGGARVAIAEPVELFKNCTSPTVPYDLSTPAVDAVTTCRQLQEIGVVGELEIPHAAVAMQLGEKTLGEPFEGLSFAEPPTPGTTDWWVTSGASAAEPTAGTIWLPDLPERESTVQNPDGHALPGAYNCQVYFPGTYESPIVIDKPTYFASGVYYFKESVTVVGGADVVVGFGLAEGCVGDLQSVLDISSTDKPDRFNIDGLGATLIFGDEARLIIDDTKALDGGGNIVANSAGLPVDFEINQRYIQNEDDGGARVAIMSVNGTTDDLTATVGTLDVPGLIHMPESNVRISGSTTPVLASSKGLVPSIHTAESREPNPPTIVSIDPLGEPVPHDNKQGAALIRWAAPVGNDEGGSTITKYEVFDAVGTKKCETAGARQCIVLDLPDMDAGVQSTFTVVATNAIGASDPSAPMSVTVTWSAPRIQAPAPPTNVVVAPTAAPPAAPADAASISWDAPPFTGNAPIVSYQVKAYRVHTALVGETREDTGRTCTTTFFRDQPVPTTCIIDGLPPLDTAPGMGPPLVPLAPLLPFNSDWLGYEFEVTATNPIRSAQPVASPLLTSTPSAPSNRIAVFDGSGTATPAAPPVTPVAPAYVPDPILDIDVSNPAASTVKIAGYVATPQGRIGIANPSGDRVEVLGGIVAGSYDLDPATFGGATLVGFQNTVLQRKIQINTTLPGSNRSSTMTVQINANGADVKVNAWVTQ